MLNLIYADLYKLSKSRALKICFVITSVCAVTIAYISHSIAVGDMSADVIGNASGLSDIVMMGLLGSLMTGILVCSDFESKLIHDAVACGNGRVAVVISKTLVYMLVIAILLIPYAVTAVVGFCLGLEFTTPFVPSVFLGILANKTGLSVTVSAVGKTIILSFITMLVYAARLSFCLPLAFKLRKPVAVMAIGMGIDLTLDLVIRLLDDVPIVSDIFSYTPYSRGLINLTMEAGAGTLLEVAGISIVFLIIMTAITHLLFRKAEIK